MMDKPDRGPMVVRCAGCEITGTDEDMIFRAGWWWHVFCVEDNEAVEADRDDRDAGLEEDADDAEA